MRRSSANSSNTGQEPSNIFGFERLLAEANARMEEIGEEIRLSMNRSLKPLTAIQVNIAMAPPEDRSTARIQERIAAERPELREMMAGVFGFTSTSLPLFFFNEPRSSVPPVPSDATPSAPKQTQNEKKFQALMDKLQGHLSDAEIGAFEQRASDLRCLISMDLPDTPVCISGEPHQIYESAQLKHWFISQTETMRRHPITRAAIEGNVSYDVDTEKQTAIQGLLGELEECLERLTAAASKPGCTP